MTAKANHWIAYPRCGPSSRSGGGSRAGVESRDVLTGRATAAFAAALGVPVTEFPSHHGGFMGGEFGYAGQPEAFAARLHEVLDEGAV